MIGLLLWQMSSCSSSFWGVGIKLPQAISKSKLKDKSFKKLTVDLGKHSTLLEAVNGNWGGWLHREQLGESLIDEVLKKITWSKHWLISVWNRGSTWYQMKHDENLNELDYEHPATLDFDSDFFGCSCNALDLLFICIGVVPGPY